MTERKLVPISRLVFRSSLPALCEEAFTKELARSIQDIGVMQMPRVRQGSNEVVFGEHRIAAQYLNGATEVEVEVVPLTDDEAEEQSLAENLFRRAIDRTAGLARYAEIAARRVNVELPPADAGEPRGPGRPKTERGVAREMAARELGTTPEAIRQAEYRQRKRDEADSGSDVRGCIEDFGVPIPPEVEVCAHRVQEAIDEADGLVRKLGSATTALEKAGVSATRLSPVKEARQALAHAVRRARPSAQCPWCKNVADLQSKCAGCGGNGYAMADQLDDLPAELKLKGGAAMVMRDGKFVPYAAKAKKPVATIVVEEESP